ncbi:MAG: FHA domain-containing protein [Myxococcales bacterium]|nr:FHA domain-containing protein [Myxococcales bacterium]
MKCDRCGRDNPPSLRFCQDCGNRLQAAPARVVEPTPPRGVPLADVRARPPAPEFDFAPRGVPRASETHCTRCGVANPAGSRFCAECGASTGAAPAPAEPAVDAAPVARHAPAVQPAPVVGLASASHEPAPVVCPRCRGSNGAHMAYCQYCGGRLQDGPPIREAPVTSPETPLSQRGPSRPPPPPARQPAAVPAAAPGAAAAAAQPAPPRPAAAAGPRARLIVVAQDGSPGRDYPLAAAVTDIGRSEGSILLPNDPYVSPRHARVSCRDGRYFIRDLGSVNGVFVRLRGPAQLRSGDLVLIGLEVLRFELVSASDKGLGPAVDGETNVFGSPILPRYARLCQRTVEGVTRDVYHVSKDELVLGREAGDVVFTSDPFMSRRHASLTRGRDGSFTLTDLGSSNGTYLAIRDEVALESGDHVRVGQHLFRLDQTGGQS